LNNMTVPGGGSGEDAQGDTGQPWSGESPEEGGYPHPGPPPGYPPAPGFDVPPGYPPPGYPPPGYPPPGYPPPAQPPGYPPPAPPAGYPPWGYGGYPDGYDQPQRRTNNLAAASLVASIIGILPFCGGILSIVGIVLGAIGLNQIKKTGEAGYGLAVAGIAVGVVTLVIGLIITVFVVPYR
jgi:hypothetical protein